MKIYLKFFPIFFLILLLALVVYSVQYQQTYRSNAEESQQANYKDNENRLDYVKGEIIIKFVNGPSVRLKTGQTIMGNSVNFEDINQSTVPESLKAIKDDIKLKSIEKVFKNSHPPSEELADFKRRFPSKVNKIKTNAVNVDLSKTYKLKLENPDDTNYVLQKLQIDPEVEYAELNLVVHTTERVPNDPYYLDSYPNNVDSRDPNWVPNYDYLWNLKQIKMSGAWEVTTGSASVIVAVSDSGVDYTHSELGGCDIEMVRNNQCTLVTPGYNFITGTDNPMDDFGHGTHVAGIITALSNNGAGIAGTGWNTRVMPVKFIDQNGYGSIDIGAESVYWAVDHGAQIINTSWGITGFSQTLVDAANYAQSHGVLWVASAGNDNLEVTNQIPANITCSTPEVQDDCIMTVAATDERDVKSYYSNWGTMIDVAAPGGDGGAFGGIPNIISLRSTFASSRYSSYFVGDKYIRLGGTSMASPHVAGLAALILSKFPDYTADEIRNVIINGSEDLGDTGFDIYYGYGRINAENSLKNPDTTNPPVASIFTPYPDMLLGKVFTVKGTANASDFLSYTIDYADSPIATNWLSEGVILAGDGKKAILNADLATVNLSQLTDGIYYIRLRVSTTEGKTGLSIVPFRLDSTIRQGFPVFYGTKPVLSQPLVADIDNDGASEIVTRNIKEFKIYVYGADGSVLPGWPQPTLENQYHQQTSTPVVADLDKNYPGMEIFFVSSTNSQGVIILGYHADGTPISSWTSGDWTTRERLGAIGSTLSVGNIGGSELLLYVETIPYMGGPSKLHAYGVNGTEPTGFPVILSDVGLNKEDAVYDSPRIGDLDGDRSNEIVLKHKGAISVYNSSGQLVFKKYVDPDLMYLADIDGDSKDEIIIFGGNTGIGDVQNTIDILDEAGNSQFPWPIDLPLTRNPNYVSNLDLGDFSGNGIPDVVVSTYLGDQYGYKGDGTSLAGFPRNGGITGVRKSVNFKSDAYHQIWLYTGRPDENVWPPERVYLEKYDQNTGSFTPAAGFPKTLGASFDTGFLALTHPALVNLPNGQVGMTIAGTVAPDFRYLYVFNLATSDICNDWSQYLHDAQHSGNAKSGCSAITSTLTPTPTPDSCDTPGDTNCDGVVGVDDYVVWLNHYDTEVRNGPTNGDFNLDNNVNGVDYMIWYLYFGK